jgi:enoyl-CoA hydratase/carnithine racemase
MQRFDAFQANFHPFYITPLSGPNITMTQDIQADIQTSVVTLTLTREHAGNMFDLPMIHEMTRQINAAADHAHCVVIRGAGPNFCRGRDPATAGPHATPMALRDNLLSPIMGLYDAIRFSRIPVIAAVQGDVLGLGCAIAGVCDMTIADESARFQLPEMEYNLPPTLAISAILDRVGKKSTAWMAYSLDKLDAHRAREMGLVNSVVPVGQLDAEVQRVLTTLTSRDLMSVMAVKEYLNYAPESGPAVRSMASNLLALALSTQAARKA